MQRNPITVHTHVPPAVTSPHTNAQGLPILEVPVIEQTAPSKGPATWSDVPWRTIVGTVAIVLVTYVLVQLVLRAFTIVGLIVIAGFLAMVLMPLVRRVERHVGGRRAVATTIVTISSALALVGLILLFIWPVRTQLISAITDLPGTIEDAGRGRGPMGTLVSRLDLVEFVRENQQSLTDAAESLRGSDLELAQTVGTAVVGFITIVVLAFAFILQAPGLSKAALSVVPHRRQEAARRVGSEIGHAISGYMIGNLLISVVAGTTAFVCLLLLGVPSAIVLALWVAFADLIPLVGAFLGAIAATFAAFLHSPTAGVVALVFFIIYQQFENSVLQPAVMARTVRVNPLMVIISVLVGVQLAGIVGALLAIPAAGSLQIVGKAIHDERMRDRLHLADTTISG